MNVAYFILCAFVFSATLNVIYFSKRHINSNETKIFSILLFLNLLGLITEFVCSYLGNNFDPNALPSRIFTKIYLIYLMTYLLYMTLYIYVVCYASNNGKNLPHYKKLEKLSFAIYFTCVVIDILLPIETSSGYAIGYAVDFVYICSSICIVIWFIPIIKNRKRIDFKKFIPLFCFIFLIILISIIQKFNPRATLITTMEFLIIFIMYHTIENPDTKIVEELHRAKEISDNSNQEKTMFLYNMTNEIREITREIDSSADAILDEADNKKVNIDIVSNSAREIKGSTAKFTTMTNEILDISQVDSQNIKIYNEKYNIKLIIKEVYSLYKSKCDNKSIDFRLNVASDIPEYLYGDSVGVKKVLMAVVDNATEYTEKGYIEFSVNTIKKNDMCRLIMTVEDSGIGMKAEELDTLFDKKEKDEDSSNLNNNLYSARKLITLMGGTIIPSSSYGKGTVIKIILDQKVAEENTALKKYENIYDKKKILLVEDSEAGIKIFSKIMNDTDIELDIVSSGKECLDKIRNKEKYDLILLDEEMSPLNGITVMKKLKEIRTFNTKVILLTRNNNYEYSGEYLKYGFSDYILKPLDKSKVFDRLDKYLK